MRSEWPKPYEYTLEESRVLKFLCGFTLNKPRLISDGCNIDARNQAVRRLERNNYIKRVHRGWILDYGYFTNEMFRYLRLNREIKAHPSLILNHHTFIYEPSIRQSAKA